jgi:hypothetical protein
MAWLGDISVRVRAVGGGVAGSVTPAPSGPDRLQGKRHVVLFVHGFNNTEAAARESYQRAFSNVLDPVGYFFWPGDIRAWVAISALSYPWQIKHALTSAQRLADYLTGLLGPERTPAAVTFICHSLGARLVLEAVRLALADGRRWPEVRLLCLMAAAVPLDLVEAGQALEAAARHARSLAIFYSRADQVLHLAFPPGEEAAYPWIEHKLYHRALGRFGPPPGLTLNRFEGSRGHSDYWPDEKLAQQVAQLLGAAGPRTLPSHDLLADPGPQPRELSGQALLAGVGPPSRPLPARAISSRRLL